MPEMDGLDLIRFIRRKGLNIKVIVLSGYDDFAYVKEAIKLGVENYLLKPINKDELSLTLLNTIDKIESESVKESFEIESKDVFKQNLLYRWVSNNISIRELNERASLIGIDLKLNDFMVVTINTLDALSTQKNSPAGNAVFNICSASLPMDISPSIFYDLNNNIIMLFSHCDIISKKPIILEFLNKCIKAINVILKVNVFTALGSIEHDYQLVYRSYSTSRDLQEYSLIYAPNTILDHCNIKKSSINKYKNIKFDMEVLNEHLMCKRKDKAFLLIEELFNHVLLIDGITPGDIQNISVEILYNISSSYKKAVRNDNIPHDLEILFSDVTRIKTSSQLIDWIKMILSKTIDYLAFCEENQNP
jgi:two-component system response regulator YesN